MQRRQGRAGTSFLRVLAALPLAVVASCRGEQAALDTAGTEAERIALLWWVMVALGTAIWVVVSTAAILALLRARRDARPRDRRREGRVLVVFGIVLPAVVLAVLFALAVATTASITREAGRGSVEVHVAGNLWWWEVRYPEQGVITANEIHIPTGEDVEVMLTSNDVIHSFWVPKLAGKTDLVPGQTNVMRLHAERPGVYRGQCAEYCGLQHANMAFLVVAQPPDEFDAWLADQAEVPPPPTDELAREGQEVFLSSSCIYCHTVAGTNATGRVGPDLTHLASRRTLAAGTVPNTRGHLGGWILDPQGIKPGNRMPPTSLSGEELQALLAYLETLD